MTVRIIFLDQICHGPQAMLASLIEKAPHKDGQFHGASDSSGEDNASWKEPPDAVQCNVIAGASLERAAGTEHSAHIAASSSAHLAKPAWLTARLMFKCAIGHYSMTSQSDAAIAVTNADAHSKPRR